MDIEDADKSVQPTPRDVACFSLEGRRPGLILAVSDKKK